MSHRRATVDPKRPETVPTILQFFPVGSDPGLAERLKVTAGWTRHVGVFTLSQERPASPALKDWIEAGADFWVLGGRDLPTASLAPWLDEATRHRLSSLGAGTFGHDRARPGGQWW